MMTRRQANAEIIAGEALAAASTNALVAQHPNPPSDLCAEVNRPCPCWQRSSWGAAPRNTPPVRSRFALSRIV